RARRQPLRRARARRFGAERLRHPRRDLRHLAGRPPARRRSRRPRRHPVRPDAWVQRTRVSTTKIRFLGDLEGSLRAQSIAHALDARSVDEVEDADLVVTTPAALEEMLEDAAV